MYDPTDMTEDRIKIHVFMISIHYRACKLFLLACKPYFCFRSNIFNLVLYLTESVNQSNNIIFCSFLLFMLWYPFEVGVKTPTGNDSTMIPITLLMQFIVYSVVYLTCNSIWYRSRSLRHD